MSSPRSFTLIELLIVIGILAVLVAAIVITLNPAQLLQEARDSKRVQDLSSLRSAIHTAEALSPAMSFGVSSTVYVSLLDTTTTCANLGLPTITPYVYHCVTSSDNLAKTNGTGWIPIDFTQNGVVSLSALPLDPVNTTSSGLYYTYMTGGSFELTALLESQTKHETAINDGGSLPGVYEVGSNLSLTPPTRDMGLVGYWPFDEATGT
ncbi:MAG: type II secretion system protein, partial [Candidatus Paceibacterota bacterium]